MAPFNKDQARGKRNVFIPTWNQETISWIIEKLNLGIEIPIIQYELANQYKISLRTSEAWLAMTRRVMTSIESGLTLESALKKDKERRNKMRRKKLPKTDS